MEAGRCWSSSPSRQHPSSPFLFSPSTLDHLLNFQHQEEDLGTRQPVDSDPPEPEIAFLQQTLSEEELQIDLNVTLLEKCRIVIR